MRHGNADGFGRDPRIDVCRGIALWWIFLDHIPNNIGSWLTLRNYGFSDAAEVSVFISGVICALAYDKDRRCEGWIGVIRRSLRRGWDICTAFLLLTLAEQVLRRPSASREVSIPMVAASWSLLQPCVLALHRL